MIDLSRYGYGPERRWFDQPYSTFNPATIPSDVLGLGGLGIHPDFYDPAFDWNAYGYGPEALLRRGPRTIPISPLSPISRTSPTDEDLFPFEEIAPPVPFSGAGGGGFGDDSNDTASSASAAIDAGIASGGIGALGSSIDTGEAEAGTLGAAMVSGLVGNMETSAKAAGLTGLGAVIAGAPISGLPGFVVSSMFSPLSILGQVGWTIAKDVADVPQERSLPGYVASVMGLNSRNITGPREAANIGVLGDFNVDSNALPGVAPAGPMGAYALEVGGWTGDMGLAGGGAVDSSGGPTGGTGAATGGYSGFDQGSAVEGDRGSLGDGGGGDGGGGASCVVCTTLHGHQLVEPIIYKAITAFGEHVSKNTMRGYHLWGKPLARALEKSSILRYTIALLARPIVREMAAQEGLGESRFLGRQLLRFGSLACAMVGMLIQPSEASCANCKCNLGS